MPGHLFGRPVDNGANEGKIKDGAGYNNVSLSSSGAYDKPEEVLFRPNPDNRISGGDGGQRNTHFFFAGEKDSKIDFKVSRDFQAPRDDATKSLFPNRNAESHSSSSLPGSTTDTIFATAVHPSTSTKTALRVNDSTIPGRKVGTKMVGGEFGTAERKPNASSPTRISDLLGRSQIGGMGSFLPPGINRGAMDGSGKTTEYQRPGANCSRISHKDLYKGQEATLHSYQDRQYIGPILHNKDGGHGELGYVGNRQTDLGVPFSTPDHDYCRMDSISSKHRGGLGIEECPGLFGVETMSQDVPFDMSENGTTKRGHLRLEGVPPVETILQLERGPRMSGNGRIPSGLESGFPVRLPAILSNKSRAQSSANTESKQNDFDNSVMADSTMVSTATVNGHNGAVAPKISPKTVVKPCGSNTPFITKLLSKPSGLADLRNRLQADGVSEGVINIMLHSRRQGTTQSYESAWKNWRLWCGRRGVDPSRCSVTDGLDYLADLFMQGRPYRSINLHRSAISAYHIPMVVGNAVVPVGKHPMVSTLMSGIHNLRPPVAKYSFTWDIEVVLDLFRSWPEVLTPKQLSIKTVTILSLIGIPRKAEVHLFDLDYLSDHAYYFTFDLPGTVKNVGEGSKPDPIEFNAHSEDKKLCPLTCIREYINLTKPWRVNGKPSKFFLTHKKPHNPASRSTLARWMKDALLLADIDTKVFQAHSLRGASTSKALLKGLSVKDIVSHGRWSRESTWQRFYHKKIDSASKKYQDSILLKL